MSDWAYVLGPAFRFVSNLYNLIWNPNEEIYLMASNISNLNLDPVPPLCTTAVLGRGTVRLRLAVALLSFLLLQIVRGQSFFFATVALKPNLMNAISKFIIFSSNMFLRYVQGDSSGQAPAFIDLNLRVPRQNFCQRSAIRPILLMQSGNWQKWRNAWEHGGTHK